MDALIGTRPSTATGCWCICSSFSQTCLEAPAIRLALGQNLSDKNIAGEVAYLKQANRASFERTYGWAWLWKLAEELRGWTDEDENDGRQICSRWPTRCRTFGVAAQQNYPIRTGVHPNTAFGFAFALDYARGVGDKKLEALIVGTQRTYFGKDVNYPAAWEPGGEKDSLLPALMEADLMRRVMPQAGFAIWFHRFLPGLARN